MALASGVPVIASDVGGIPEVVEHGITGYLAPVGEIDRMADCPRRRAFAAVARSHAAANFDYHKIVPQYEAIYERVLESP